MERNIPDVRDIFGKGSNDASHKKQELRTYDYSPRSRRKFEAMDRWDVRITPNHHEPRSNVTTSTSNKKNRHRQSNPVDALETGKQNKKSEEHPQKNGKSKDSAHYSNRTLTERDIKHLERHLSMKKTIRKQISRNLAQAFVDEAEIDLKDLKDPIPTVQKSGKVSHDRSFTLTRAKVSKSEQNVLDLLKDNEPDSGHCSADNPNSSDDDSQEHTTSQRAYPKSFEKISSGNSRPAVDTRNRSDNRSADPPYKDDGKFSFWKMFSVKNRGKR